MKFRKLKKTNWLCRFTYFESNAGTDYDGVIEHKIGALPNLYADYEYDNGLYLEYTPYHNHITWKDLKYNLKKSKYKIQIYTGICPICHNKYSLEEFFRCGDIICSECWDKRFIGENEDGDC